MYKRSDELLEEGVRREGENRLGAHRPEKEGERLTPIEVQPPGERWNPAVPNHHTPSFQRADYHNRDDDTRTVAVCYAILLLKLTRRAFQAIRRLFVGGYATIGTRPRTARTSPIPSVSSTGWFSASLEVCPQSLSSSLVHLSPESWVEVKKREYLDWPPERIWDVEDMLGPFYPISMGGSKRGCAR